METKETKKQNPKLKILWDSLISLGILGVTTGLCYLITYLNLDISNCLLLYLIGIMVISILTESMAFSFFSGFISLILYNILFVEPVGSLAVYDMKSMTSILFTLIAILMINLLAYLTKKKEKEIAKAKVSLFKAKTKEDNDNYKMILLRSVSHDMRTPLTTIQMASSLALDNIDDKNKVKEMLEMIKHDTSFLSEIVGKQLLLTKVETLNQSSLKKEIIPIEELIDQARNVVIGKLGNRKIEIKSEADAEYVFGDFTLLSSVFQNIFDNFIKFTEDKTGIMRIGIKGTNGGVCFTLENNGPKIKDEDLPKVFDLYFSKSRFGDQGSNSKGTGMGLTICQAIIKLHGGEIKAYNTDFGPCFEFWLPDQKGKEKNENTDNRG